MMAGQPYFARRMMLDDKTAPGCRRGSAAGATMMRTPAFRRRAPRETRRRPARTRGSPPAGAPGERQTQASLRAHAEIFR